MRYFFIFFIGILFTFQSSAQDYSILKIPVELLKDANLIKRNETVEINIKDAGHAIIKRTYAYTILNDKGDPYAEFTSYYDKFQSIDDIEGKLFDATGKELKKVRKKDISDLGGEAGMSVSDNRSKNHSFYHKDYPYTIEYTSVVSLNGMFWLPGWVPQLSNAMGVQQSKYTVKTPSGYSIRFKEYNYSGKATINENNGGKSYEWIAENIKPVKLEPMMPHWSRVRAYVAVAPNQVEIDGFKGSMTTWKEFGNFLYQLSGNRDELPPEMAMKAKQMTEGIIDPYKKIDTLYKFMQDNTRYISIQLGIGGWQPIAAEKVAKNGYGDCKALTNYMSALLRAVGIGSKYAVINSGDDGLYTDASFVSNQFDHAILCVPLAKDTVWLECTSSILPAGYLGDFTYNRPALLVDETGGTIVRTPVYRKNENLQVRQVEAIIEDGGNLKARSFTRYTGLQQDNLQGLLLTASREDVMKAMRNRFDLPTYDVVDYQFTENGGRIPELTETIDLTVTGYAQVSGKRLFVMPNVLTRSGVKLVVDSTRKFEVELDYDYLDTDTVTIRVPSGYEIESMPKAVKMQTKFGNYTNEYTFDNDMITYIRTVQQNNGRYPSSDYADLANFYQTIHKSDRMKIVLKKKE
jgi:hypothetical protein